MDEFDTSLYNEVLDKKYKVVDDSGLNVEVTTSMSTKKRVYNILKFIIPKGLRLKIKKFVAKLYNFVCER